MAYSTPTDELDQKMKQILQEIVDKYCFDLYETHERNGDNCYTSKIDFVSEVERCITIYEAEILKHGYKTQISTALGNMILFEINIFGFKSPKILW